MFSLCSIKEASCILGLPCDNRKLQIELMLNGADVVVFVYYFLTGARFGRIEAQLDSPFDAS